MTLTLLVRSASTSSRQVPRFTLDAPRIVIGRSRGCEVRLPDPSVSQRHASIHQRGSEYLILDEGSVNGTIVGQVRLPPQAPRLLTSGDLIRVGRIWLEVRFDQLDAPPSSKHDTHEIALALVADALAQGGQTHSAQVSVQAGPDAGATLPIEAFDRHYSVGRAHADLTLNDPDISRRHLEVVRRGEAVMVRDLGSKNGTYLKNQRLEPNIWVRWDEGNPVKLGNTRLTLEDPVLLALRELEGAADEHLQEHEALEPPPALGPEDDLKEATWSGGVSRTVTRASVAPTAHALRSTLAPPRAGKSDLLIALLALLVLATSALGLFWLFGAH